MASETLRATADLATAFASSTETTVTIGHFLDGGAVQRSMATFGVPAATSGVLPRLSFQVLVDGEPAASDVVVTVSGYDRTIELQLPGQLKPGLVAVRIKIIAGAAAQFGSMVLTMLCEVRE